jgi:hypothetical protein
MAFLDLETDIKPWLGIKPTDTSQDAFLTMINAAVEQSIKNYCETDFESHVVTKEILDGNDSDIIIPKNIPIISVQAIYFSCDTAGDNGYLVEVLNYQVLEHSIVLQIGRTPFCRSRVRVDYTYGYAALPADVKLVAIQAVEAEFRRKNEKSLIGGRRSKKDESEETGSQMVEWDGKTGIPKVLVYKLSPYKSFEFPCQPMAQRNY